MGRSNYVQLSGNLGAMPEVHESNQVKFVVFPVYTQSNYYDKESKSYKRAETVDIHDVIIFETARSFELARRLEKGDLVEVEGKLSYTKRQVMVTDGETGEMKEVAIRQASVRANNIELIFGAKGKDLPEGDEGLA